MIDPITRGLLATDLDGTLAVGGVIGMADRKTAAALKERGIPVLIVTGRNQKSLNKVEGLWDVADEVLFSSGAGLLAAEDAIPVEQARLTVREVRDIVAILNEAGEDYCVLNPIPGNHHYSWMRHRPPLDNPDFDSRMDIYAEWGRPDDGSLLPASQVLIIRPPGMLPDHNLEASLAPWSVFYSSSPIDHTSVWLEIFPAGMNKGSALAAWCGANNIARTRVLALGNDHNDETMLSWAGMGRVVDGAPSALKSRFPVRSFEAAAKEAMELFHRIW
ncbi:MAG: HAD family phosphatase [Spirochaetaceae bacterium]|nr:HAD family phosphatase [Spirochaetaceae bacterium]